MFPVEHPLVENHFPANHVRPIIWTSILGNVDIRIVTCDCDCCLDVNTVDFQHRGLTYALPAIVGAARNVRFANRGRRSWRFGRDQQEDAEESLASK